MIRRYKARFAKLTRNKELCIDSITIELIAQVLANAEIGLHAVLSASALPPAPQRVIRFGAHDEQTVSISNL
jgi:hypothetical protein